MFRNRTVILYVMAFCSVVFLNHQRFVSLFHDHLQAVYGFTAPWSVMMKISTWAQAHATHCTLNILVDLSHFSRANVQARFALSLSSLILKLMVSKLPMNQLCYLQDNTMNNTFITYYWLVEKRHDIKNACSYLLELAIAADSADSAKSSGSSQNAASDTSDTEHEDGCGSPRVQRRKRRRNKSHSGGVDRAMGTGTDGEQDDLAYVDTLPEVSYVE